MTHLKTYCILLFLSVFSIQAYAQAEEMLEWANQGTVTNKSYNSEIPFRYVNGYIFVDIIQNNKNYNFLFDTGSETTVIDTSIMDEFDFKPFAASTISGPVVENGDIQTITVARMIVSDVEFVNIGAVSIDLDFLKAKFCEKLDGIIGTTLMKKAKWQIDYENKVIRLSNDVTNLVSKKPTYVLQINLPSKGWGTETIALNIDGYSSQFDFDTGNGRDKIVTHPNTLKNFATKDKTSVAYGFKKSATDYKFIAERVTMGNLELTDQAISLQNEVGNFQLLGNRFFENFRVTVDWEQHQVFLEPTKEIPSDKLLGFELDFKPNFEHNTIEIATGLKGYVKEQKIEKSALLLKVNEIDVSNFSHQDFCEFWNVEWPKIMDSQKLNIAVSQKGKIKELSLQKKELL